MRLRTAMAGLLIATMALATGCTNDPGDDGVATAQSTGQPSAKAASPSATADARRFATCLRERGLDVADPAPGEQVEITNKDDKTRDALRACAQFAPPSQQEQRPFDLVASRAYAACIRDNGFPDFPDPDESGPRIPKNLIGNEQFKTADRECAHHLDAAKGNRK